MTTTRLVTETRQVTVELAEAMLCQVGRAIPDQVPSEWQEQILRR